MPNIYKRPSAKTIQFKTNPQIATQITYGVASSGRLLKIIGLFCKRAEPYSRNDILPKRPIILSSLLTVATP